MSRRTRGGGSKRSYRPFIFVALVAVTGVVGYYIFTSSGTGSGSPLINTPASTTVLNELASVSPSTLNAVGSGANDINSPTPPTVSSSSATSTSLTLDGKPEILYMGAEYCPYCGAERWALIVALDKFGTFTGIEYMQSSSTDVYPNTPTFTFVNATYSSSYISLVTVEQTDRNQNPLQTATAAETALINTYDPGGGIPFVDFDNQYFITGVQYLPTALRVDGSQSGAPLNWTQVASQVNTPSSIVAQNVDGAANRLMTVICKIDGNQPSSVCSQAYAQITLSYTRAPASNPQPQVSDAVYVRPASSRLANWV